MMLPKSCQSITGSPVASAIEPTGRERSPGKDRFDRRAGPTSLSERVSGEDAWERRQRHRRHHTRRREAALVDSAFALESLLPWRATHSVTTGIKAAGLLTGTFGYVLPALHVVYPWLSPISPVLVGVIFAAALSVGWAVESWTLRAVVEQERCSGRLEYGRHLARLEQLEGRLWQLKLERGLDMQEQSQLERVVKLRIRFAGGALNAAVTAIDVAFGVSLHGARSCRITS